MIVRSCFGRDLVKRRKVDDSNFECRWDSRMTLSFQELIAVLDYL